MFLFFVLYHLIIGILVGLNFWFRDFWGFDFYPHSIIRVIKSGVPPPPPRSNLEALLILRGFFEWYLRIFPNLSMSKVNANTKANVQRSKKSQIKMLEVALLNCDIIEKELQC